MSTTTVNSTLNPIDSSYLQAAHANPELIAQYQIIRRDGSVVAFAPNKITIAMMKTFLAVEGNHASESTRIRETVQTLTELVLDALIRRRPGGGAIHIEDIQDQVELALMRSGEHDVARAYVLYREKRAQERATLTAKYAAPEHNLFMLEKGIRTPLKTEHLVALIESAATGFGEEINRAHLLKETLKNLYDGVPADEVRKATVLAARTMIEQDPAYSKVTARLLLNTIRFEILGKEVTQNAMQQHYRDYFAGYIAKGIQAELLDARLAEFDLPRLAAALDAERDFQFEYLGLQTLFDRYFLHINEQRIEMPQAFFMRVAMGLAINETDRNGRAIEFYNLLSSFDFMSSTPTLFNAGTRHSQLSSCYLTTIADDLAEIYEGLKENALLSKYAGGLGNDWTSVRAMGSHIKGTNGKSQGVVPFLKVVNDTAVAVNQCFSPDTYLHTADGIKRIRDTKVGDLVLGISGTYREVKQVMIYNQHDAMVSVNVKHAIEPIQVTAGHPFFAISGVPIGQAHSRTQNWLAKGKVKPKWIEAGKLKQGDFVAQVIPTEIVQAADFEMDDARMYGILLGDGHLTQNGMEWGVSGNPQKDSHLAFVRSYLEARGIHSWESVRGDTYIQIRWASGHGVVKNGTTGRIVGAGAPTMPFTHADLYNDKNEKRIAWRFSHLPLNQTRALIQGLLETDGGISRGKEIYFTSASRELAEGIRYQCLRLGIPSSGQYRTRENAHTGTRSDGSLAHFSGVSHSFDVRIPAVAEIANLVRCQALNKRNWLTYRGCLYSRIRSVNAIPTQPFVFDLIVEGDESYMTTAALAHNGGKRKGAVCAYLETWHADIEEFLELRKNTGDDRRRTHDMNTANWIPDLFMKRVMEKGEWTLFSPSECPDLHDKVGVAFEEAYTAYEAKAARGEMRVAKKLPALNLWRKMLTMLFETGHPWMTFKDPCNIRSPQQHVGVVHSSNLCTEITLNTNESEIAVCNLGSINLVAHLENGSLNRSKLQRTIRTAMRMLDNVIDINFYPVEKARNSNLKHRPVGLGLMGFQDCLHSLRIPYASTAAVEFADQSMELIAYYAYQASTELAEERGTYESYPGSLWHQGILPQDSIQLLEQQRGGYLECDRSSQLDWQPLRNRIAQYGMRNSNCLAIAPTATISNIIGVSACIEPTYQNLFVKSNLSGEFTVVNEYLVRDLKARDLWDEVMIADLKYYDGSLAKIDRIPEDLRRLYATAFELPSHWIVEAAARRQKWIDQAQSLNIYMAGASGKKLDEIYKLAWVRGLKTTYYLRTLAATSAEKSTGRGGELNAVPIHASVAPSPVVIEAPATDAKFCSIDNPDCESCQ